MEQETQEQVKDKPGKKPWQILNERDKGVIVTHFLHGLSPSQIAVLAKRSLPFVYEVLQSEEAQEAIAEFEREQEQGLLDVNDMLKRSRTALLDQVLTIALEGKKEGDRLNAAKHGLALAGMVPIQKVAQVSAKVVIQGQTLDRAQETLEWLKARKGQGNGNGDSILNKIAGALNATGPGRAISIDLSTGGTAPTGVEAAVPGEHVLPGEGGAWVRSADELPPLADLRNAAKQEAQAEVVGAAAGPLQEHDGNEDVPAVAPGERPSDANPYY